MEKLASTIIYAAKLREESFDHLERIKALQIAKKELYPELEDATAIKNNKSKSFIQAKNAWMKLHDQYEVLDREEKFLSFKLQGSKTLIQTPKKANTSEPAKSKALAALNALPLELRKQVLANFK